MKCDVCVSGKNLSATRSIRRSAVHGDNDCEFEPVDGHAFVPLRCFMAGSQTGVRSPLKVRDERKGIRSFIPVSQSTFVRYIKNYEK